MASTAIFLTRCRPRSQASASPACRSQATTFSGRNASPAGARSTEKITAASCPWPRPAVRWTSRVTPARGTGATQAAWRSSLSKGLQVSGGRLRLCLRHRIRCWQLPAEHLAHLGEVAGDAVLLPGELVDLALSRGAAAFDIGLDLGEQLLGLGLGLADDLVGVLFRVADELPGVLVGVPAGLVGLGRSLGGPLLRGGGPLLRFGHELLRRRLGGSEPFGFLALGLFPARRELHLELGLGLGELGLALLQDPLRLAAHLVGLTLRSREDLVPVPLG